VSVTYLKTKSLSKRKLTTFQNSRHIGDTVITKATYTIYSSKSSGGTSVGDTVFTITAIEYMFDPVDNYCW
jgi:hypothetical protein